MIEKYWQHASLSTTSRNFISSLKGYMPGFSLRSSATLFLSAFFTVMTASAADQIPDTNAPNANQSQIAQTLDGTPVQNIVAPNAAGLSHNKFTTFNVTTQNLIINNSNVDVVSQIGGALLANPNLAGGMASTILNEVTSANRSILQGDQELVGDPANYILANPNGITCDGCGFVDFPRATLTTGSPVLSGDSLNGFDVDGGDVLIESLGLNAEGADFFDIISRSISINGKINANDLNLVAGRNTVDYATKVATAKADDGSTKPGFAIDSSILGGMYANRISLVGTEAGVGVSMLGDMAASVDDITLDVDGKITFNGNDVSAVRNIVIESSQASSTAGNEIELTNSEVYASNNLTLTGGDMSLSGGRSGAGNDVTITANSYSDTGTGLRDAGNDFSLAVTGDADVSSNLQAVNNATITAANLTVNAGQVVAASNSTGNLSITIDSTLTLTDGALGSGNTATINAAAIALDVASNASGTKGIVTTGSATINATSSIDNDGYIGSDADLAVTATNSIDNSGYIGSTANLTVTAGSSIDNSGHIGGDTSLTVNTPTLTNLSGGALVSAGTLTLENNGSAGTTLTTESGSEIKANDININFSTINNNGSIYAINSASLTASDLTNASGANISSSGSLTLNQAAAGGSFNNVGDVEANAINLSFDTLTNSGDIYTATTGTFTVDNLTNSGNLLANGTLKINASAALGTDFTNTGTVDAGIMNLYFTKVTNDNTLYSASAMTIVADELINHAAIHSDGTMSLAVRTLTNTPTLSIAADIIAAGDLTIAGNNILNNLAANGITPGIISTGGTLGIHSTSGSVATQGVYNDGGLLFGATGLSVLVTREFINQNAAIAISTGGTLHLGALDSATLLGTTDVVTIKNLDSRIENTNGSVSIFADYFENSTNENHSSLVDEVTYIRTQTDVLILDEATGLYNSAPTCGSGITSSSGSFMIGGTCRIFYKETYNEWAHLAGGGLYYPYTADKFYWEYAGVRYGIDGSNCGTNNDQNFYVADSCVKSVTITEEYLPTGTNFNQRSALLASNDIDIWVETEARNYVSLISAGNNITVDGPTGSEFINEAISLDKTETATIYVDKDSGIYVGGELECGLETNIWDLTGKSCFWVGGETHYKGWNTSGAPVSTLSYGIPSTVEAGGTITVGVDVTNSNAAGGDNNYVTAPTSSTTTQDPALSGSVTSLTIDPLLLGSIDALASSPFFVASTNPTSPYVYVTDPKFASLQALYGSDLFIEGLGLDPDDYLRLGDPYYEQQLLRQQLLADAGQRFIADGFANEDEQFKYLLENGIRAGKDLPLRIGVALTAEQINSLEKDIVWMVEAEVNGQTVLVPQLYLSSTTRANLAEGAKFVASTINITTEGPVTNSGAFVANDISVDSGSFTNRLGRVIATEDLNITTVGDILNESGTIQGGNVTLESEQGSVINRTLTQEHDVTGALGSGTNTEVGDIATIQATNDLTITAEDDIVSEGGQLNAGNNATLDAGDEITLTVIEVKNYSETHEISGTGSGFNSTSTDTTTSIDRTSSIGSGLNVGGDLTLSSGGDTNVIGSDIQVAGDLNVEKIGGNLNVTTYEDKTVIHSETKTFTAGGGGTVETDKDKGNAAATSTAKAELSYKVETTTTDITATTHNRSSILVGGNLNADEGAIDGDINITGSDIATGGDLNLKSGGDLNILAAEDKIDVSYSYESEEINLSADASVDGVNAGIEFEHNESSGTATETTAQVSTLSSGGDINIDAGGDFTEQGTQVTAGGELNIEADSVTSLAAENTYSETGESLSVSVGVTAGAETGLGGVVDSFIDKDGNATVDMADAAKSIGELDVPDAGSASVGLNVSVTKTTSGSSGNTVTTSSFTSGGSVNITAREGDAEFHGTNVEAGGSINVTADEGDVKILTAVSTDNSHSDTTNVEVSVSVSGDGSGSLSGSGGTDHTDSSSTTHTVASFKAGEDVNLTAKNDVEMVGTNIEAGGTASVTAEEGGIEYKAAYDTTETNTSSMNANASIGGGGGEGSIGGGGGESSTHESTSTGTAGSISATNIQFNAKKDITLEGTNLDATNEIGIETEGKLDVKAVEDTHLKTADGYSFEVEVSADPKGGSGGVSGGGSGTDEYEQSTTRTGGSINAANLTIKTGQGVSLEGTDVTADAATIDTGEGALVVESAVSTHTKTVNNTSVEGSLSADKGAGSGSASLKVEGEYEDTYSETNKNANLNIGSLDIKAKGGIDVKGSNVAGLESVVTGDKADGGTINTNGAEVRTEQRVDVERSEKSSIDVSVGVVVPGKKLRDKVSDDVGKVKDKISNSDLANTARNKVESATASIKNKVATVTTGVKNKVSDVKTGVKNIGADSATRDTNNKANETTKQDNKTTLANTIKTNKDASTDKKLTINTEHATTKENNAVATIAKTQKTKDQKADYDQQKADNVASETRTKELAAIDKDKTLDDTQRQQKKDDVEQQFVDTKKTNADTVAGTKKQNAEAAATAKTAYAEKTGERKATAEDKALTSKTQHAEDNATTRVALADKVSDTTAGDRLKTEANADKDQAIDSLGKQNTDKKADIVSQKEKTLAQANVQGNKNKADIDAQTLANKKLIDIEADKSKKEREVDADTNLTQEAKDQRKQEIASEIETKKTEVAADLASDKSNNETKASNDLAVANAKAEEKKAIAVGAPEDKKKLLTADREQQEALGSAFDDKQAADRDVKNDSTLSEQDKSRKQKENTETFASAEEAAKTKYADDIKNTADARGSSDHAKEKDLVDQSSLSVADKQAKNDEIDKKYDEQKLLRQKDHDNQVEEYKAEAKHAKDIAGAEDKQRQAVMDSEKSLASAETKAGDDKTARDLVAETRKTDAISNIDSSLSDADQEKEKVKIEDKYVKDIEDSKTQKDKDIAAAKDDASKKQKDAESELKKTTTLAHAALEKKRSEATAKAEENRVLTADTNAKQRVIENSRSELDEGLIKAEKDRADKFDEIDAQHNDRADVKQATTTRDENIAQAEKSRKDMDGIAVGTHDQNKKRIENDTKLSDSERTKKLAENDAALADTKKRNAENEQEKKDSAESQLDLDVAAARGERNDARADALAAHVKQEEKLNSAHTDTIKQIQTQTDGEKALAQEKRKQQDALSDAIYKKTDEDLKVLADNSLSDSKKSEKLRDNAKELATAQEKAKTGIVDAEREARDDQSDSDSAFEKSLIDDSLTDAEKQAKEDAIDSKYDEIKTAREKERDRQVETYKTDTKHAEDIAEAVYAHRNTLADSNEQLEIKKGATSLAKTNRDQAATTERDNALDNLDPSLSAEDRNSEKEKIKNKFEGALKDSQTKYDQEVLSAKTDADKKQHLANTELRKSQVIADAEQQKKRNLAQVDGDDRDRAREKTLVDSSNQSDAEKQVKKDEIDRKYDEQKQKKKDAIEEAYTKKVDNMDARLAAWNKDIEGRYEDKKAANELARKNAELDSDTTKSAEEKKAAKAENQKEYDTAHKDAEKKISESKKEFGKLLSSEEKKAAAGLAENLVADKKKVATKLAEKLVGDKKKVAGQKKAAIKLAENLVAGKKKVSDTWVKNPYAKWPRIKHHMSTAMRWKKVLTSVRPAVAINEFEEEEEEAAALPLPGLLTLVKQFSAEDQGVALNKLPAITNDPDIKNAMFVSGAIDDIRAEAKDGVLRDIAREMHGSELRVLTVDDKKSILGDAGYEIDPTLSGLDVIRKFDEYLDNVVSTLPPTLEQKKEMLLVTGKVKSDEQGNYRDSDGKILTDGMIEAEFNKVLSDGKERLGELAGGRALDEYDRILFPVGI